MFLPVQPMACNITLSEFPGAAVPRVTASPGPARVGFRTPQRRPPQGPTSSFLSAISGEMKCIPVHFSKLRPTSFTCQENVLKYNKVFIVFLEVFELMPDIPFFPISKVPFFFTLSFLIASYCKNKKNTKIRICCAH